MIVAFTGIDGSGKSAVSIEVSKRLVSKGLAVKRFHLHEYFILSPVVRLLHALLPLLKKIGLYSKKKGSGSNPFLGVKNKHPILKFWTLFAIFDNLVNYSRLAYFSLRGFIVLCDRYFYDRLIGFEYHGYLNKFLYSLYLKLTPSPDLVFVLDVGADLAKKRETKDTHSLSFYRKMRQKYRYLSKRINCVLIKINQRNVPGISSEVLSKILAVKRLEKRRALPKLIIPTIIFLSFTLAFLKGDAIKISLEENFLTKYSVSNRAHECFVGDEGLLAPPISENSYWATTANEKSSRVEIPFSQPVSLDGISIFFWGNLDSVSSFLAEDFDVFYKDPSGELVLLRSIKGNTSSSILIAFPQTVVTSTLELRLKKAPFFDIVKIGDLKFLTKEHVGFFAGLRGILKTHDKGFVARIFYGVFFLSLFTNPGIYFSLSFPNAPHDQIDFWAARFHFSFIGFGYCLRPYWD